MSDTLTIPLPLLQQAPRAPASPFAVAVAASVVLHMAAFAWAAQQERVQVAPAPKDVEPVAIRSVHMDVPPLKPVTPPPPVVEQAPPPQVVKAPAAPKAKTKPKKVRRVKRRQRRQAAHRNDQLRQPATLAKQRHGGTIRGGIKHDVTCVRSIQCSVSCCLLRRFQWLRVRLAHVVFRGWVYHGFLSRLLTGDTGRIFARF